MRYTVHCLVAIALTATSLGSTGCKSNAENGDKASSVDADTSQATSLVSCDLDDLEHSGEATLYAAGGKGACSLPVSSSDRMVAALNSRDFADSASCGACVEVDGPNGSVTVRITDLCPGCGAGDIDLSTEAFAKIAHPDDGRVSISWTFVACEVDGPLVYHFKEGSNQWWTAVQARNHRFPIDTVEIKADERAYKMASRSSYNYFVLSAGLGAGPYDVRVTDTLGHVVEDSAIAFAPDTSAGGSAQFPECAPSAR